MKNLLKNDELNINIIRRTIVYLLNHQKYFKGIINLLTQIIILIYFYIGIMDNADKLIC